MHIRLCSQLFKISSWFLIECFNGFHNVSNLSRKEFHFEHRPCSPKLGQLHIPLNVFIFRKNSRVGHHYFIPQGHQFALAGSPIHPPKVNIEGDFERVITAAVILKLPGVEHKSLLDGWPRTDTYIHVGVESQSWVIFHKIQLQGFIWGLVVGYCDWDLQDVTRHGRRGQLECSVDFLRRDQELLRKTVSTICWENISLYQKLGNLSIKEKRFFKPLSSVIVSKRLSCLIQYCLCEVIFKLTARLMRVRSVWFNLLRSNVLLSTLINKWQICCFSNVTSLIPLPI